MSTMTAMKSNPLRIKGKVLWSGNTEVVILNEDMLIKSGMTKEEAHKFMLELIEIVEEDEDDS